MLINTCDLKFFSHNLIGTLKETYVSTDKWYLRINSLIPWPQRGKVKISDKIFTYSKQEFNPDSAEVVLLICEKPCKDLTYLEGTEVVYFPPEDMIEHLKCESFCNVFYVHFNAEPEYRWRIKFPFKDLKKTPISHVTVYSFEYSELITRLEFTLKELPNLDEKEVVGLTLAFLKPSSGFAVFSDRGRIKIDWIQRVIKEEEQSREFEIGFKLVNKFVIPISPYFQNQSEAEYHYDGKTFNGDPLLDTEHGLYKDWNAMYVSEDIYSYSDEFAKRRPMVLKVSEDSVIIDASTFTRSSSGGGGGGI